MDIESAVVDPRLPAHEPITSGDPSHHRKMPRIIAASCTVYITSTPRSVAVAPSSATMEDIVPRLVRRDMSHTRRPPLCDLPTWRLLGHHQP